MRALRYWAMVSAALVCALLPKAAEAQDTLRLHGGLGAGLMVSPDQLDWLGYDGIAGRGWLAVGHALDRLWIIELHGATSVFGAQDRDNGTLFEVGGGMRIDFLSGLSTMRLSPAAHLNMGITGGKLRPTLDVGVALLLDLNHAWSLGPAVHYGQVFQPDGERYSSDARYFTFGLAFGFRNVDAPPKPRPKPPPRPFAAPVVESEPDPGTPPPEPPPEAAPSPELQLLIEGAVGMVMDESKLIPPVLFEYDSVELIPCGEAALFYARDIINVRKGPVTVEGHADSTGNVDYNLDLAQRRAERVRDWLIEHGVDAARLRLQSRGECCGIARETDDSRRQINRRVIIHFGEPQ